MPRCEHIKVQTFTEPLSCEKWYRDIKDLRCFMLERELDALISRRILL